MNDDVESKGTLKDEEKRSLMMASGFAVPCFVGAIFMATASDVAQEVAGASVLGTCSWFGLFCVLNAFICYKERKKTSMQNAKSISSSQKSKTADNNNEKVLGLSKKR